MSDGFQHNQGRRSTDGNLQQRLDAMRHELELTKALLHLTELRLNAALGMPPEEIANAVRKLNELPS